MIDYGYFRVVFGGVWDGGRGNKKLCDRLCVFCDLYPLTNPIHSYYCYFNKLEVCIV